jgi:hypothetical protein
MILMRWIRPKVGGAADLHVSPPWTISRSEPRDNEYGVEETQGNCGIYICDVCVSDFLDQDEEECGD